MKWTRRIAISLAIIAAFLGVIAAAGLFYTYQYISTPHIDDPSTPLLTQLESPRSHLSTPPPWEARAAADQISPLSLAEFQNPAQHFGPWTRWWWPGNLVQSAELQREMQLFADAGLAGVEIQPFAISVSASDKISNAWQQSGWDSPEFYGNLHTVLDAALALNMEVDLNNGSGWPTGGPPVAHADGMRQLLHSELFVTGPRELEVTLPSPQMPAAAFAAGAVGMLGDTPMQTFIADTRELVAVVAAKVVDNQRTWQPWDFLDQVVLDPNSRTVLQDYGPDGVLRWLVPEGRWAITALWQMPGGELISGGYAHAQPAYVVDHMDAARMRANQNYLFREETGLSRYYGKPLRAIFNDSLEFRQERHWARGHLQEFEHRLGYDPRPWLAALIEPGKDQMPFHAINVPTLPAYDLGADSVRFLEDWDQVTSDLFRERYFKTVQSWARERQLAHRLQAYGGPMDVIRGAGESDIPEAEQLYAGGSEMFLKAVSSGAHIAGKPLVSAESFIFMGRAFMTTPLKIKALADKAFTAGINQIVYHGSSYQVEDHAARGYPATEGWYPWQLGMISTDYSENWPYWQHARVLNDYIARSQYLLRKGQPEADVLLLYPGLGFPQGYGNPAEPFDQGNFAGEEPLTDEPAGQGDQNAEEATMGRGTQQMRALWREMRTLESEGLTWAWINEDALRAAHFNKTVLHAGGLRAAALRLHDITALSPEVAEHVSALASAGLPVQITGNSPQRQRGLADHERGDQRVQNALARLLHTTNTATRDARPASPVNSLGEVKFRNATLKTLRRRLEGGGLLQFFSNPSDAAVELNLTVTADSTQAPAHAVWLDAWDGSARRATVNSEGIATFELPPYGSIFLWLRKGESVHASSVETFLLNAPLPEIVTTSVLQQWQLAVPTSNYHQTENTLGDWLEIESLRDSGGPGIYTTNFTLSPQQIEQLEKGDELALELGTLFGAATVSLNGQAIGAALIPPYRIALTGAAKEGQNTLRVELTPPRKNRLVEAIENSEPGWNSPDLIGTRARVSAGLIGPVQLLQLGAHSTPL